MRLAQKLAIQYIRTKFRLLSTISKRKAAKEAFELFCTPQYRNRKKIPPVFAKGEALQFQFRGSMVRGWRCGPPSEKKLLILHGFESSVINFDRYVKPLVQKGYEVLAFDAPAHGRSSGRRINVLLYRDLIFEINRRFGPIKNFLAHSLGGLSLCLALEEWKDDEDIKAVLIAPAAETTTAINHFFHFLRLDKSVREAFDQHIVKLSGHPPAWFSIARILPQIKASVLYFQDEDDEMTPVNDVEPIKKMRLKNVDFTITKGLGHRRIYRDNSVSKTITGFF